MNSLLSGWRRAEGTLECGSSSYRLRFGFQGGVKSVNRRTLQGVARNFMLSGCPPGNAKERQLWE